MVSTGQYLNPPRSLPWTPKRLLGLFRNLEVPIKRTNDPRSSAAFFQISPELVDEILLYLEGDRKAILSCALVSRLWVPSVRRVLFWTLDIKPRGKNAFFPFLHFLASAPVVCGYVKALTLNGCFLFTRNHFCPHLLTRLLSALPSLKQLKIHCTHFDHPSPFPPVKGLLNTLSKSRERRSLFCQNHRPCSTRFVIDRFTIDITETVQRNYDEFLDMLSVFSEIRCLEVFRDFRYARDPWKTITTTVSPPTIIRELKATSSFPPMIHCLGYTLRERSLHGVGAALQTLEDLANVGALFKKAGPTIQTVMLYPQSIMKLYTTGAITPKEWKTLELSSCTSIRAFKLIIDSYLQPWYCYPVSSSNLCVDLLACVPRTVQAITLCIQLRLQWFLDWNRLEEILLSFEDLRTVTVECWNSPGVEYMTQIQVEELLPRVRARDVFRVMG
ncbi:hypothetical protein NLI96_g5098 [Meripilus lineatus]|uniref:F-box domain-containing protein n=1 Tax=Meripilus lineatus TaxID=2056292 RepID=A0AAD5V5B7_9APHY|nr:hypothetical protein NLI96_g5098 [Physisporinus lineatus]